MRKSPAGESESKAHMLATTTVPQYVETQADWRYGKLLKIKR